MVVAVGANDEVDLLVGWILSEGLGQTEQRILGGSGDNAGGEDGGGGRHDVALDRLEALLGGRGGGGGGERRHGCRKPQ